MIVCVCVCVFNASHINGKCSEQQGATKKAFKGNTMHKDKPTEIINRRLLLIVVKNTKTIWAKLKHERPKFKMQATFMVTYIQIKTFMMYNINQNS